MDRADPALVERILAETGVDRVPQPPQAGYLGELSRALFHALADLIARASLSLGPESGPWILGGLGVLTSAALGWIAWSLLRRRRPKPRPAEDARADLPLVSPSWDAEAWRAELERCLAEERIGEALRAAWWWLARSIAGPEAEPDWTSRDLAVRTRRRELRDLLRRLDTLTFGADRPGLPEVRRLAEQIRGTLG